VTIGGRRHEAVPIHRWPDRPGWGADGPAIVEQDLATVFVPPGYRAELSPFGDLDIRRI
jgi:N-methylhydantoinase A/oxoprolinase/acetone carboxylase beta subunit